MQNLIKKLITIIKKALVKHHWALLYFFPDKHRPYKCIGGRVYLNIKESPAMLARALGIREESKTKAISTLLRPAAVFIDIGSNKGEFSIQAASIVGHSGKVFAFEPEPNNCCWIRKTIRLNKYENITLFELALSDKNGQAELYLGEKSGWHSLLPGAVNRDRGVLNVATRTLDSIMAENGQKKVEMIKIDVEGAELQVLKGASETLSNNEDIILLIDIHRGLGIDPREVCHILSKFGFSFFEMKYPFNIPAQVDSKLKEVLVRR